MFFRTLEIQISDALGRASRITEENSGALHAILTRQTAVALVEELLSSPALLDQVSQQSYRHTLGFDKFTLLDPGQAQEDGSRGYGWQLRLHIWWPGTNRGVPILEGMHEHSFDFVSTVLTGEIENQRFTARALSAEEQATADKLYHAVAGMADTEKRDVNDRLEALFALRLGEKGSRLPDALGGAALLNKTADAATLCTLLDVSERELETLIYLHDRFESVSSSLKKGAYTHQMTGRVMLDPVYVQKITAGESYFHPHTHIHRLFNQDSLQATLLMTTPVSQTAKGGSLQRPTYVAASQQDDTDIVYRRQMYAPHETAEIMQRFLSDLER